MNATAARQGSAELDISLFAGVVRKLDKKEFSAKVGVFMLAAQADGIVTLRKTQRGATIASLHPSLRVSSVDHNKVFQPLLSAIKRASSGPGAFVSHADITALLAKQPGSDFRLAVYATLKEFIKGAKDAGFVQVQKKKVALK